MPLISVIIPTYNCAEYISGAIESVLHQTFSDYEIIVVDDGSTDGTDRVVEQFPEPVRLLRQENRGPAAARNAGIRQARGDLIAFLDGDDKWLPRKLELQCAYMKSHPAVGLVFSDANSFIGDKIKTVAYNKKYRKVFQGEIFDKLIIKNFIACITVMLRKECLEKVGMFPENFDRATSEDWHLWLRIAKNYEIGYIEEPLALYRLKAATQDEDFTYAYPYRLLLLDEMAALYPDYFRSRPDLLSRAYAGVHMRYGYALFKIGDRAGAKKQLSLSIRRRPLQIKSYLYLLGSAIPAGIRGRIARLKSRLGIKFMPAE